MEKRYDYITPEDYATAEKNGITKSAMEQRVYSYGWDIDRAITQPMRESRCFQSVWDKWGHQATKNGISRAVFYSRINTSGWSESKAASTKMMRGGHPPRYTDEEREIARRNGLDANFMGVVTARIEKLGWTKEDALNTPKLSRKEQAKRVAEGTRKYYEERGVNREFNKTV